MCAFTTLRDMRQPCHPAERQAEDLTPQDTPSIEPGPASTPGASAEVEIGRAASTRPFPNKAAAERNRLAILQSHPWMDPEQLNSRINAVMEQNSSLKSKRAKFISIANEVNAAVAPHAACKVGCSHCCHISVIIFKHEADRLSHATGRQVQPVPIRDPHMMSGHANRYQGQPCPFLIEERCSVYDNRPVICRLHHSIDDAPNQCDLTVVSTVSSVPTLNLKFLELAYTYLGVVKGEPIGDIREFFPTT